MSQPQKYRLLQVAVVLTTICFLALAASVSAGDVPSVREHSDIMWQIITALFGVLNTILTGVIVWIISQQSELFGRLRKVEADQQTTERLCEERHAGGRRHYDPEHRP